VKPLLIIGLGNPLMGDDGVGVRVSQLLAADSEIAVAADVIEAGTDLLSSLDRIEGRRRVILVDAVESLSDPGRISVIEGPLLEERAAYVHSLSAAQAVELMRKVMPGLQDTRFTWVLVHVPSARVSQEMSPEVAAAVPLAAAVVKGLL